MRALLLTLLLLPATADAAPECPEGNLLAGRKTHARKGMRDSKRLTDGKLPPEGDAWKTEHTTVFASGRASATYDLGRETTVRALLLQGDNNDTYTISLSKDGETFDDVWTAEKVPERGMRLRHTDELEARGRYLRVGRPKGDRSYSAGEIQAFCQIPETWPPALKRTPAGKRPKKGPNRRRINARRKMVFGGLALLVFVAFLARRESWEAAWTALAASGAALGYSAWLTAGWWGIGVAIALGAGVLGRLLLGPARSWLFAERSALVGIALAGALSWTNYGVFHGSRAIHLWDTFHYYVGAKYFDENRYTRIYHCSVIGELDDGRRSEMDDRRLRDLRDNSLGDIDRIFPEDALCRDAYADDRWDALRQDVRLFRAHMGTGWFKKMFMDHGYNATPVWTTVGRTLASVGWRSGIPPPELAHTPANLKGKSKAERKRIKDAFAEAKEAFYRKISALALIDGVLEVGIFGLLWWAFGLRAFALALVVFGVGYPWDFHFTGGSFGRVPWMFMATAGVCLLKKGYPALGGVGLTTSALLRIFPAALYGGLALKIGHALVTRRTISVPHRRLIAGSAICLGLLFGGSAAANGGFEVWGEFFENSFKHKETRLTNHMGLPTLLSYDHAKRARRTKDDTFDDPFERWKEGRKETLAARGGLFLASLLLLFGLVGYIAREADDWEVAALSTVFVVGIFELTCYYYCFVVLLAPICVRRLRYTVLFLAMAVSTQWVHLGIGWYDVQYTVETAVVLGFMLLLLVGRIEEIRRGATPAPPSEHAIGSRPRRRSATADHR